LLAFLVLFAIVLIDAPVSICLRLCGSVPNKSPASDFLLSGPSCHLLPQPILISFIHPSSEIFKNRSRVTLENALNILAYEAVYEVFMQTY
jgi:hypothetical protein